MLTVPSLQHLFGSGMFLMGRGSSWVPVCVQCLLDAYVFLASYPRMKSEVNEDKIFTAPGCALESDCQVWWSSLKSDCFFSLCTWTKIFSLFAFFAAGSLHFPSYLLLLQQVALLTAFFQPFLPCHCPLCCVLGETTGAE